MFGTFDLKISFKCNNNCVHCAVADKRKTEDIPFEEIKEIIQGIPEGYAVQITGGEPTICTSLPKILKECKARNLYTLIQTNGTGFSNIDFLRECKPYLDQTHLAIHSCYPKIHDNIVGTEGMWEKTIQGMDNLISENMFFTTQTVLSRYNIESLYDTFSFIQKKKPGTRMSMTYPHLMGNASKNRNSVAFRYSEYKDIIQETLESFYPYIFSESIPFCYLHPYAHLVESLERDLITPELSRVGIDKSEQNCYKDYNFLNLEEHKKGPLCKECIYDKVCVGVWEDYIKMYKNNLDLYPIELEE